MDNFFSLALRFLLLALLVDYTPFGTRYSTRYANVILFAD